MAEGNCNEALHRLYHFLDGELTAEKRADIAKHLDDCPPCGEAYDFEAELRIAIARKCVESVPEDLIQRISDAIAHEAMPPH